MDDFDPLRLVGWCGLEHYLFLPLSQKLNYLLVSLLVLSEEHEVGANESQNARDIPAQFIQNSLEDRCASRSRKEQVQNRVEETWFLLLLLMTLASSSSTLTAHQPNQGKEQNHKAYFFHTYGYPL